MKYDYALPSTLIGVSVVLAQPQIVVTLSLEEVVKIGREITVQIVDSQNPFDAGSGVTIKRSGNTYTVLTAYHVVKNGKQYKIITPDKQNYQLKSVKPLPKLDLAVIEFSSDKNYSIAKIGNSDKATASTTVYLTGFPAQSAAISHPEFFFNKGQIYANGTAQRDGYNIIYDNDSLKGMSGGAVLNEQGELIAIHGRTEMQTTGFGTTVYLALQKMLAVGVDVGVRPSSVVATGPKADDFDPKIAAYYYQQGIALLNNEDETNAAKNFQKAADLYFKEGNKADGYISQGLVRAILKDYQGAIAAYTQSIQLRPTAEAYEHRSNARFKLGDNQGSLNDKARATSIIAKGYQFWGEMLRKGAEQLNHIH